MQLVSVNLNGCGFGNKVFKIFAGLQYAEKYNKEFVIDRSLNTPLLTCKHTQDLDNSIALLFPKIRWVDSIPSAKIICDINIFIYNELPYYNGNVILYGFFQNEKYFPLSKIPNIRTAYYPDTYFIHIRAGDYINNPQYDILPKSKYYSNCLNILGSNVKYIVFSNDNEYANNLMKQFKVQYTISDKIDPLETLIEMANCAGGICANSTLSWLGAFFQREPKSNIFMPNIWLNNAKPDMQTPAWARVIDIHTDTMNNSFDIVIPIGPNDTNVIHNQLSYTMKNIVGYRNIYIISNTSLQINGCISVSENSFPFTIDTVAKYHGKSLRNGWYLQQLLKLYAGTVIPGILNTYLVLDSDTFFLKPTKFLENRSSKPMYAYGNEYNIPYFNHMAKLDPSFKRTDSRSGICHHMIFQRKYLDEIFTLVESRHGGKFYEIFLKQVAPQDFLHSGASEYEMYFNYMLQRHPSEIIIRDLKWQNVPSLTNNGFNDYESVHWYIRSKA